MAAKMPRDPKEALRIIQENGKAAQEFIKKRVEEVQNMATASAYRTKIEMERRNTRNKILSKMTDTFQFVETQRGNPHVREKTEEIIGDIKELKRQINSLPPEEFVDAIDQITEKHKTRGLIEVSEGDPDEVALINEKISKIYKNIYRMLNNSKEIMEERIKKER